VECILKRFIYYILYRTSFKFYKQLLIHEQFSLLRHIQADVAFSDNFSTLGNCPVTLSVAPLAAFCFFFIRFHFLRFD